MIQCPNCGRENADNFNFCLDCGYDLKAYREEQAASPEPPVGDAPAPAVVGEELGAGAPTESMNASDVQAMQAEPPAGTAPALEAQMPAPMPEPAAPATPAPLAEPQAAPAALQSSVPLEQPTDTAQATPVQAPADSQPAAEAPAAAAGGGASPGMQQCPACGTELPAAMKFCGNCGKRLDGDGGGDAAGGSALDQPTGGRTMFMHAADVAAVQEKICKLVTIDQTGNEGMTFTLKSGDTVCGRVNGIILFFDDPYVSPTHCEFSFHEGKLQVRDQNSLNGIYLRLKQEQQLYDGDFLRIGRQLFRFESLAQAATQVQRSEGDDAKVWGSPVPEAFGRLLQILEDGRTGEIRVLTGDSCNLGREQGEIVFPTDGFISGRHCAFARSGESATLKDLGSSNGTYVRIKEMADVLHGDFLLIGNQMLRVEIV